MPEPMVGHLQRFDASSAVPVFDLTDFNSKRAELVVDLTVVGNASPA